MLRYPDNCSIPKYLKNYGNYMLNGSNAYNTASVTTSSSSIYNSVKSYSSITSLNSSYYEYSFPKSNIKQNVSNYSSNSTSSTVSGYSTDDSLVESHSSTLSPNSSYFGDSFSKSTIKQNVSNYSSNSTLSTNSTETSFLSAISPTDLSEHSRYIKSLTVSQRSSERELKSTRRIDYSIAEPHAIQLNSRCYTKPNYRRDSLESITPLCARIAKYQQQLNKHEPYCPLFKKEYEQNFAIGERIAKLEKLFANKPENKLRTFKNNTLNQQKPLRVATPDRARELVEKYFNNTNPRGTSSPHRRYDFDVCLNLKTKNII